MKIRVICENSVVSSIPRALVGEHGLSFLIEGEKNTLYDTGQGTGILNNLRAFGLCSCGPG